MRKQFSFLYTPFIRRYRNGEYPFQAFWVRANGNNATLTINEKAKTSSNGIFFRSGSNDTKTLVRIRLKTDAPNVWDEAVIGFHDGAFTEYDPELDALKIFAADTNLPNIALVPDTTLNDPYSIAMVPIPVEDSSYDLLIKPGNKTSFSLENTLVDSFDSDICMVLEDREMQTTQPFNMGDVYAFTVGEMDLSKRFALHVTAPLDVTVMSENCPNANNGTAVVQGFGEAPWTFTWLDEMGNIIRTTENSTSADVLDDLAPGFYEVRITNNDEVCNSAEKIIQIETAPDFDIMTHVSAPTCNNQENGLVIFQIGDNRSWDISLTDIENGTTTVLNDAASDTLLSGLSSGIYEFTASNFCENSFRKSTLELIDNNAVTASFETSESTVSIADGGLIQFNNTSSTNCLTYKWEFGDGTLDSLSTMPAHSYQHWGQYNVRLTASNENCTDTFETTVSVTGVQSTGGLTGEEMLASLTDQETAVSELKLDVTFTDQSLMLNPEDAIEGQIKVKINSITGQLVMEKVLNELPAEGTSIDISSLNQGLYTFGIQTEKMILKSGEFAK